MLLSRSLLFPGGLQKAQPPNTVTIGAGSSGDAAGPCADPWCSQLPGRGGCRVPFSQTRSPRGGIPNQILSTPRAGEKGAWHPQEGVFLALFGLWAWKKLLQAGPCPAGPCSLVVLEEKLAATKATREGRGRKRGAEVGGEQRCPCRLQPRFWRCPRPVWGRGESPTRAGGGIRWVSRSLPTQSTPILCIDPPPGVARCLGMCPEGLCDQSVNN